MSSSAVGKIQSGQSDAETVEALTRIWERLLGRTPIGPEEKFGDLGGHDALVDRLFAEITQTFRKELPSATISYAPTIKDLAPLLKLSTLPHFSPFVPLKAGGNLPPILIAHGVGGRASFGELAKHIPIENPIYGIQAKGVDGLEKPFAHIEDMADYYLDALRELQPGEPYFLIGYSFGGLIALEMAQRLTERGKHIALLAMVDTYPHPRYMPPAQRVWLEAKRVNRRLTDLKQKPFPAATRELLEILRHKLGKKPQPTADSPRTNRSPLSFAETTEQVKRSDFAAMRRYRPRFYSGRITFIRPEANSYLPNDPSAVWSHLAADFTIETVPGDHLGMIATHFHTLGLVLARFINEASGK